MHPLEKESSKKNSMKTQPEIIFKTRSEAEDTLERLLSLVKDYGVVTIAELYDSFGKTSTFRDNQFGWTDLRNAYVKWTRTGYLLGLPHAERIK